MRAGEGWVANLGVMGPDWGQGCPGIDPSSPCSLPLQ